MHRMNGTVEGQRGHWQENTGGITCINLPNSGKQAKVSFFGFTC
jgi:hypothetical protein